jgi:hypothetical protein
MMHKLLAFTFLLLAPAYGQQPAPSSTPHTGPGGTVEYWDVLPLSGNTTHPIPPVIGEKVVKPKFTRELLRLEWRFGDPIDLYVIRPAGAVKPPVVLFLYSYPTDSDRFLNDQLCESLTSHGFAAVGFVSALTGQRYHDRPMREWFVSELPEALGTSVHDVQLVLNYLGMRGDLDMSRVGMFGQGSGGAIAILSAAVDPRIKAVDVLDPWGDWPDWLAASPQVPERERANYLTPQFLAGVAPDDPLRWLNRLDGKHLRMQETLFTATTPPAARNRLEQAAPANTDHIQYKTEDDYIRRASTGSKMLDWMQQQLCPAAVQPDTHGAGR